jgi:phosphoribosylanthranilate isomerase
MGKKHAATAMVMQAQPNRAFTGYFTRYGLDIVQFHGGEGTTDHTVSRFPGFIYQF